MTILKANDLIMMQGGSDELPYCVGESMGHVVREHIISYCILNVPFFAYFYE